MLQITALIVISLVGRTLDSSSLGPSGLGPAGASWRQQDSDAASAMRDQSGLSTPGRSLPARASGKHKLGLPTSGGQPGTLSAQIAPEEPNASANRNIPQKDGVVNFLV